MKPVVGISLAMVVALSSVPGRAAERCQLEGTWVNTDEATRGVSRIDVREEKGRWVIRAWAKTDGGEVEQGKAVTLAIVGDATTCFDCEKPASTAATPSELAAAKALRTSLGDATMASGFAYWDFGFADCYLTLRREKDRLSGDEFVLFKDGSGRTHYRSRYEFQRPPPTAEAAPE
jgi:hypothetical protein